MRRRNFFSEEMEVHILRGHGDGVLLDKLVAPVMNSFPLWGYNNNLEYSIDALEYLKKKIPYFAKVNKIERRDNFYMFCVNHLREFADQVHQKYKNK